MKKFDVAIIGQGITGLSAALHLRQGGIKNLCIIAPHTNLENTTALHAHYATVSLQDNITRFAHNQGTKIARDLIELNRKGFSGLQEYLQAQGASLSLPICHINSSPEVSGQVL